jgi:hypothetical protein
MDLGSAGWARRQGCVVGQSPSVGTAIYILPSFENARIGLSRLGTKMVLRCEASATLTRGGPAAGERRRKGKSASRNMQAGGIQ